MSFAYVPGKNVQVPEIEYHSEVRLPAPSTALIVVDMQNDFLRPDCALFVPAAANTVPRIRSLLDSARAQGVRIAYTQDTHLPQDPEWHTFGQHAHIGTEGWEFIEGSSPSRRIWSAERTGTMASMQAGWTTT